MKYIDINAKFTAAVNNYLAQGYIINTASMSGSQGEVAHIDLTNGKQIVRVLLDSFTEWEDYNNLKGLKLVVGIATTSSRTTTSAAISSGTTVWKSSPARSSTR